MEIYQTKKGYYYQIINGVKRRISSIHALETIKGGSRQPGKKPANTKDIIGNIDYIASDVIRLFINDEYKTEVCGHLLQDKHNNTIFTCKLTNVGGTEGRRACAWDSSSKNIWHTHVKGGKVYPSVEDLVLMMNTDKRQIKRNSHKRTRRHYIFTSIGYWTITNNNMKNHNEYYYTFNDNEFESLKNELSKCCDELYTKTIKGRVYDEQAFNLFIHNVYNVVYDHTKRNQLIEIKFKLL